MAIPKNRQKILDAALSLFNRDGLVNVRLQHISDESIVSLGNISYHFRNKDAIVHAIWEQLKNQQRILLDSYRVAPLFEDTERLMQHTFALQQAYRFFYLDTLEIMRAYPDLQPEYRQQTQWQVQQMLMSIQFNEARGAFVQEPEPGFFIHLAEQFWFNADLWLYQQSTRQQLLDHYPDFRQALWFLFVPLFSEMGKKEFAQLNALILEKIF